MDLRTVIEAAGVELRPAGSGRLRGLCPFHQERTPSFFVFEDRQKWRCFGCGEHGDGIDFVRRLHGFTYRQALAHLGVESPRATAEMVREIKRRRAERTEAEWREREVAWTIGTAIRRCHEILKRITPDTLDAFALILTHLSHLTYEHDILIHGDAEARASVVAQYDNIRLFRRGLLFRKDFDIGEWLRGIHGAPNDGQLRVRGTSGDTKRAASKAA